MFAPRFTTASQGYGAGWLSATAPIFALTLLLTPQVARADCTSAPDSLQKVVCGAPQLSATWNQIEAQIDTLKGADADLSAALDADQVLFGTLLNKTLGDLESEHSAEEVGELILSGLQERLEFLRSVQTAKGSGVEGMWQNAAGYLRLGAAEGAGQRLRLSVMEPIMGLRTCSLDLPATVTDGMAQAENPPSDEISALRAGQSALLGVDFTRSGRPASGPADCNDSPSVSGWYFSVKDK